MYWFDVWLEIERRLVPGGLAESTGLLAVNDEVLEVNGIEVAGKSLDQVTDMMVANSANLIITVKPANQRGVLTLSRASHNDTMTSYSTTVSMVHSDEDHEEDETDDLDEIKDLTVQTTDRNNANDDGVLHLWIFTNSRNSNLLFKFFFFLNFF